MTAARLVIVTDARDDDALIDLMRAGLADLVARRTQAWPRRATRAKPLAGPRMLELVGSAPRPAITGRQAEVLRLVAAGRSNKEAARALGVSPATVKTHVAQVLAILGASNRTDAVTRAGALGLI